jgi:hypothetical protein
MRQRSPERLVPDHAPERHTAAKDGGRTDSLFDRARVVGVSISIAKQSQMGRRARHALQRVEKERDPLASHEASDEEELDVPSLSAIARASDARQPVGAGDDDFDREARALAQEPFACQGTRRHRMIAGGDGVGFALPHRLPIAPLDLPARQVVHEQHSARGRGSALEQRSELPHAKGVPHEDVDAVAGEASLARVDDDDFVPPGAEALDDEPVVDVAAGRLIKLSVDNPGNSHDPGSP